MENNLLQELAKIGDVNSERLMIVIRRVSDKDFIGTFGDDTFARIDITVSDSIIKLFSGKNKEGTESYE